MRAEGSGAGRLARLAGEESALPSPYTTGSRSVRLHSPSAEEHMLLCYQRSINHDGAEGHCSVQLPSSAHRQHHQDMHVTTLLLQRLLLEPRSPRGWGLSCAASQQRQNPLLGFHAAAPAIGILICLQVSVSHQERVSSRLA
ncbi:unnamed protein product [Arctogadus glacialis]